MTATQTPATVAPEAGAVQVEQCDRDAAAAYLRMIPGFPALEAQRFADGEMDHLGDALPQRFARHRLAAQAQPTPSSEQGAGKGSVRDKAVVAMRAYVESAGVPISEFDPEFVVRMMSAMMVSFHKYGLVGQAYPLKFNAADDVRARMAKYRQTGNKHYLVDAANFAMIEAMHPGRAAEWGENDAADSPGRTTASGHRLVHETNDGDRLTAQERGI